MIYDNLIIGGGFFGLYLANYISRKGKSVVLIEKERDFMSRASFSNQARVHHGYHYPRSILTALRASRSYPVFIKDFEECVDSSFQKYYAISRLNSKINSRQFREFSKNIRARCDYAPSSVKKLFNLNLIEDVFETDEIAFNSTLLRKEILYRISGTNSLLKTDCAAEKVDYVELDSCFHVKVREGNEVGALKARQVFNCTYSNINGVLPNGLTNEIPVINELAEICLVKPPCELVDKGITVMCGPFFSIMPFPAKGLHSFSHVSYTPHLEWLSGKRNFKNKFDDISIDGLRKTNFKFMQRDSMRYLSVLKSCVHIDSLWEIKTILPRNKQNDGRPILFIPDHGVRGFHCIVGAKIDNVYDMTKLMENNADRFGL